MNLPKQLRAPLPHARRFYPPQAKQLAILRVAFLNNDSVIIQIRFNYPFQQLPLPKTRFPKAPHFCPVLKPPPF